MPLTRAVLRALLGLIWCLALALFFFLPFAIWLGGLAGDWASVWVGYVVFLVLALAVLAEVVLIALLFWRNDVRILWPIVLITLWALIWVLYTPSLLFAGPGDYPGDGPSAHEVFLFFVSRNEESGSNYLLNIDDYSSGGVYESVPLAAAIGGLLCGAAFIVGRRVTHRRIPAALAFVASYAVALVLLWTVVSPALWGPVFFTTD